MRTMYYGKCVKEDCENMEQIFSIYFFEKFISQLFYGTHSQTPPCFRSLFAQVPVEETGDQLPYKTVEEFIERAKGKYPSGNYKEGIVIRPIESVYSKILEGPLSMKVINNDYLLKQN